MSETLYVKTLSARKCCALPKGMEKGSFRGCMELLLRGHSAVSDVSFLKSNLIKSTKYVLTN